MRHPFTPPLPKRRPTIKTLRNLLLLAAALCLPLQPTTALSLEGLFSDTQWTSMSDLPQLSPTGTEGWLVRLQTPKGKELADALANYRETGMEILEAVVLAQIDVYLPYVVTETDEQTTFRHAVEARDWHSAGALIERKSKGSNQPELLALIQAMLNTLQGRFRMTSNLIAQIPAEIRTQSPLVQLAQAQLHLQSREYANCREQIDNILGAKGLPKNQHELQLVRVTLLYLLDQREQAAQEYDAILLAMPEPAQIATEIGRRLLASARSEQAAEWFLKALQEDSSYTHAAVGLVQAHVQAADYPRAQQQADQWLLPDVPQHRRIRAQLLRFSGHLGQALEEVRTIRRNGSTDQLLVALEAHTLLDLCRPDEADRLLSPEVDKPSLAFPIVIAYVRTLRDLGRYAEIDRWLIQLPDNVAKSNHWRLLRAWWSYEREEYVRCSNDLDLCLADGFQTPAVYALFGAVHFQQHNRIKAQEAWEKTYANTPQTALFQTIEAEANLEAKRLDECATLLENLLKQQPDAGSVLLLKGRLLNARGLHQEGIDWCQRALEAGAPGRDTRIELAKSYLRTGRNQEAQEQVDFLYQHYPLNPSVLVLSASLHYRAGNHDAAARDANLVLNNGGTQERSRASVLLGQIAIARNQVTTALEFAEAAVRIGAPLAGPYILRGEIRFDDQKYVAAEADFTRAIRLEPELEDGYAWRARTLQAKDLFRDAIRDYTEAIRLAASPANRAGHHLQRALCYVQLQGWEYARIDLDRARELAPNQPEILFVEGRLAAAQGNWQVALDALNRYLQVRNDPVAETWRDRSLQALGRATTPLPSPTPAPPAAPSPVPIQSSEDQPSPSKPKEPSPTEPPEVIYQAIPVPAEQAAQDPVAQESDPLDRLIRLTTSEALEAPSAPAPTQAAQPNEPAAGTPQSTTPNNKPPAPTAETVESLRAKAEAAPTDLAAHVAWVRAEFEQGDADSLRKATQTLRDLLQNGTPEGTAPELPLQAWKECIARTAEVEGPAEALSANETAISQLPEALELHLSAGKLAALIGDLERVGQAVGQVLARDPNHIEARLLEVQWLQQTADPETIESKFQELAELAPKSTSMWTLLARYKASQKDWDGTLEATSRVVALGSDTPEIRRLRASAFSAQDNESKAMEELARATWLDPDSEETVMHKATIQVHHRKLDWAFDNLVAFYEKHPENPAPLLRLCQVGWIIPHRRHTVIQKWLPTALERFPELPEVHTIQAGIYLDLNLPQEAALAAAEAVRTGPDNPASWLLLGKLHAGEGKFQEARTALDKVIALDPSIAEAWSDLGAVLLQLNETEAAVEHLTRAATLQPDAPLHFYRLGIALMRSEEYLDAAASFARVRALQPDWIAAWTQGISAELKADNQAKAEEIRTEAKSRFPNENWDAIP